jgi:large subunit ribosomal protein L2
MGKNLRQQRRGRGTLRFKSPNHRFVGAAGYIRPDVENSRGTITDIRHCPAHSAPLLEVDFDNGQKVFMIATEEKKVGDMIDSGKNAELKTGNVLALRNIPDGTEVFNIESQPGDGGKFARSGGNFARVVARTENEVTLILPSKKQRKFSGTCRATVGRVAGAGKLDKPLLKAGNAFYKTRAKNIFWPHVCGQSMNAVAHPHGGKRSSKKNHPLVVPRSAPPGAKVGLIAPRRTGRRR